MVRLNTPDERWAAFGYETHDAYATTFVIDGRWSPSVPDDVKVSYETVEHLMAYAYYHYPMYDDAFKRLLTIMEMAVKLRARQGEISLTFEDRRGRIRNKTLGTLITEVIEHTDSHAIPEV